MDYNHIHHRTLRSLLEFANEKFADRPFLYFIDGAGYTYGEFYEKVTEVSRLLYKYGIRRGDFVGLLSQNMPSWAVAYFATVGFGMVTVPMLPDFSESEVKHILKHSAAKAMFVSKKLIPKIHEKAFDRLSLIVCIDDFSIIKGEECAQPDTPATEEEIDSEALASLIYTSGTTGSSKGVMLSHKNLCATLKDAQILRPSYDWDVWLSLLPLSHTLECSLCLLLPMTAGASVYYMEKAPTPTILMQSLAKVRPTTMLSVPLIIEKLYKSAVLPKLTKTKTMARLYRIAPFRKMMHKVAGKELIAKFGGRIRFFGIGGAKLDRSVERFLLEAKFPYAIGYGLTETSPLIAGATPELVKIGSTGPIVDGVTAKLLDKDPKTGVGEIVVKGDNVMMGYYQNPEATSGAFTEDGWFRTKDLGMFDRKGWLYIKGRASTTIIGPSGENIYPEDIESVINDHELVSESVVTSRKGRLTALIHFDSEKLKAYLEKYDERYDEMKRNAGEKYDELKKNAGEKYDDFKKSTEEKIEHLKREIMEYVNEKVSKFSRISDIEPQEKEFEKTATKKIKRYLYEDKSDKNNPKGEAKKKK